MPSPGPLRFCLGVALFCNVIAGDVRAGSARHWAFTPVADTLVPPVHNAGWAKSPLDHFVLAKLEANSLTPAPQAKKLQLLRRVYFDLIGLPPPVEKVEEFLVSTDDNALEKVIDSLLASPQYGERWGRHWLDVARYADTAGESADYPIPQAHLYRNYVIDSFNADKPYNQFLKEQIAGDLLPASNEKQGHEQLIATGFVALARRFSVDPDADMHLTIEDALDTLGRASMGLTLSCARCHDHKFDPISAKDYYALYGIFSSTRFPFPGSETKKRQRDFPPLLPVEEVKRLMGSKLEEIAKIEEEAEDVRKLREQVIKAEREGGTLPTGTKTSLELLEDFRALRTKMENLHDALPAIPSAYALAEGNKMGNARVQLRGEPGSLGEEVPRHFLTLLGGQLLPPDEKGSGRREMAEWITNPANPLTARVMVNRIWHYHFGRGLVATTNDFGTKGAAPSNLPLLDWLATRFVEGGWSMKKMHKLILLSATWQQSADSTHAGESALRIDPENYLLWHFPQLRLDAESTRDAMLVVSGNLDPTQGGAHPFPPEREWKYTQHDQFFALYETNRRSVYVMQQRLRRHPFFSLFDGADTNISTGVRFNSTTPLQSLFLMNDAFCHEQARGFARRILAAAGDDPARVDFAHRTAFARPATEEEKSAGLIFLGQMRAKLGGADVELETWSSYARVLLTSNEFVFLD